MTNRKRFQRFFLIAAIMLTASLFLGFGKMQPHGVYIVGAAMVSWLGLMIASINRIY